MAASSDYVRQIYETEIGQPADQAGIDYWRGTGLDGDALVKAMRYSAGMDNTAYDDPAYSAFARTLRAKHATISADRDARLQTIRNQRALSTAGLDLRQEQGLQQVDNDAAARGMYSSGGRVEARQRLLQQIAQDRATQENDYTQQEADTVRQASNDIGSLSQQRDEEEVAARGRLTAQSIANEQAKRDAAAMRNNAIGLTNSYAAAASAPRPLAPRDANRPGMKFTGRPTKFN